ncbi:hypothetical protein SH1V18_36470 [Vallitalea longa]|uniref:Uncharacterized protein n=1 Tax=Vallitalea longa TaxID=2936439 RepID=A0A9W5YCX4_9FIRM|nr:hypothetical protein [Vallitalea longa]GKX31167.1 hypothetical protein SH1V18_36470 [Vallitalea longa]
MKDNKNKKAPLIIGIVLTLIVMVILLVLVKKKTDNNDTSSSNTTTDKQQTVEQQQAVAEDNNITEAEKEEISKYVGLIYDSGEGEKIPEFEDINNANEDWAWLIVCDYLQTTTEEYKMFTADEVQEAAKVLYGNDFNKKFTKDSSRHVKYYEDEDKYVSAGMGALYIDKYEVKDMIKKNNQYIINIIEYTYTWSDDQHQRIVLDSKSEEITSFNQERISASTDEEVKLMEEESASIDAKMKDYVLENVDKFQVKELVLEKDKETEALHIISAKNK